MKNSSKNAQIGTCSICKAKKELSDLVTVKVNLVDNSEYRLICKNTKHIGTNDLEIVNVSDE
jgi:hypothetical protein